MRMAVPRSGQGINFLTALDFRGSHYHVILVRLATAAAIGLVASMSASKIATSGSVCARILVSSVIMSS